MSRSYVKLVVVLMALAGLLFTHSLESGPGRARISQNQTFALTPKVFALTPQEGDHQMTAKALKKQHVLPAIDSRVYETVATATFALG